MMKESEIEALANSIRELLSLVRSVQMATLDADGNPEASYTPFLLENGKVYIFVSELAAHTQNLKRSNIASLLFIEDETASQNIFARQRVVLSGRAQFINREDTLWPQVIDAFEKQHGQTVNLLKTLSDFWLVEFSVLSGAYVRGFGQAYQFDGFNLDSIRQVTGR